MRSFFPLLFCTLLSAYDLSLSLGTALFQTTADGNLIYAKSFWKGSASKIEHESSTARSLYAELRHNIRFVPNVRVEQSTFRSKGVSNIHIETENASVNELISTLDALPIITLNDTYYDSTLQQTQQEFYLFYTYEPENWPRFDMGAGIDRFYFDYAVTIIEGLQFNDNGEQDIPMLYLHTQYEAFQSLSDIFVNIGATMKYYAFGPSNVYDASLETSVLWPMNANNNLGITLGLRRLYMHLRGDDVETVGGRMIYNGAYIGLRLDIN